MAPDTVAAVPVELDGPSPFTIVGIGASAGGLEALTSFLQSVSPSTGMAYVVVQHLAPQHDSALAELLGTASRMPVVTIRHGMAIKSNRVHVVPPNVELSVAGGRLQLLPRPADRTRHTPIDTFFESLAHYARRRAVGIVLSGSASDGALGLREIKTMGGIAIAQDPETAGYDSMPRAAIATGIVDLVLPPEAIGGELTRLSAHSFVRAPQHVDDGQAVGFHEHQLTHLFHLLRNASGVDFTEYKLPTINRRLQRRMVLHKATSLAEYFEVIERDPAEVTNLYKDLLIHVTRFFRDPESFVALQKSAFPEIVADAGGQRPIRIWVPGCATGEEAYSVAMAILEYLGAEGPATPLQVFATDVAADAVERARSGTYPESISADVSAERLGRFFVLSDGHYRITKLVRDSCVFARQDLTRDPPFSKLDLIVCRNVMIYLGIRLQRKLLGIFHYALRPAGFLMLGGAESVGLRNEPFTVIDRRHKIYVKKARPLAGGGSEITGPYEGRFDRSSRPIESDGAVRNDVHSDVTRLLIDRYSPPAVVVNQEFQILHTRGKTGSFLELSNGDASLSILKMARDGLLHPLRSALHEARKSRKPAHREAVRLRDQGTAEINLQVLPVGASGESPHFLVLFEPSARLESTAASKTQARPAKGRKGSNDLERMREELSTSRDFLQSVIQDLEAANEELQSANEEILSSNEELQSTNEELDTAKEELTSTNEELNTVNEELNARNDELTRLNSDLTNLLAVVPAAVVIVDAELNIRRFTPLAETLLNLIPTDVGRSIGAIKPNINVPDLDVLTREVIDTVSVRELEVRDRIGRYYTLRVRPYKNQDQRIEGAVLAFSDVDAPRRLATPSDAGV